MTDRVALFSSLSVRSFAKLGSSVSVVGLARFGSVFSMSVLDFICCIVFVQFSIVVRLGTGRQRGLSCRAAAVRFFHVGASWKLALAAVVRSTRAWDVSGWLVLLRVLGIGARLLASREFGIVVAVRVGLLGDRSGLISSG